MHAKSSATLRAAAAAALVTVLVFAWYMVKPDNLPVSDPIWAPHVAASMIYDGDPFLDEYRHLAENWGFFATLEAGGHLNSYFPVGGEIIAIPQLLILDAVLPQLRGVTLQDYLFANPPDDPFILKLQLINASVMVAFSAGVIYLIGREYLKSPYAFLLAATYAFATSAYSTASRAMWQHGPSMLMLSVSLLLLVKARKRPGLIALVGLPLAAAFIIRPTNSVSILVITLYILLYHRRQFLAYVLLMLLLTLPFALNSLSAYGSLLPPYYSASRLGSPSMMEALAGNLVSPARGVFVFSPILLLAPLGIVVKWRKGKLEPLDWAVALIIVLHWLVISSFAHWWAGHSFGPRFFVDMMPYMVYLLIAFLELAQSPGGAIGRRIALNVAYVFLLAISIAIHYRGATSPATHGWNSVPTNVDEAPGKVWDWGDIQFMRGMGDDLIALPSDRITVSPGDGGDQETHFDVGLMTDGPIDLTLRVPGRVTLQEHTSWLFDVDPLPGGGASGRLIEPLTGIGSRRFDIEIDTTNLAESASLNAIELVARKRGRGGEVIEETQIIQLDTAPQHAAPPRPSDIQVTCTPAETGELYALFGSDWYDEESAAGASWRWAASPAYLHVWTDSRQTSALELSLSSLHEAGTSDGLGTGGVMRLAIPGSASEQVVRAGQPARFDVSLEPGWNTLAFELASGNFSPVELDPEHSDTRQLSFSIDAITIAGRCATPAAGQ